MNQAASVGLRRVHQRGAQRLARVVGKIRRGGEGHRLVRGGMDEPDPAGVQINTARRRAAIQCVTENRKMMGGGVDADLMCFAGERFGFDGVNGVKGHGNFKFEI